MGFQKYVAVEQIMAWDAVREFVAKRVPLNLPKS